MPPAFIRTGASEPPASIRDRRLFETRRLQEHWRPQAPASITYRVYRMLTFILLSSTKIDSGFKLVHGQSIVMCMDGLGIGLCHLTL